MLNYTYTVYIYICKAQLYIYCMYIYVMYAESKNAAVNTSIKVLY